MYLKKRHIVAMRDIWEELFTVAGFTMGDYQKRTMLSSFETQFYLQVNFSLWGVEGVHVIVKMRLFFS